MESSTKSCTFIVSILRKSIMNKLPHIGSSIFTVMSKMATEYNAINLSQGFPNFPVDERLTDIVAKLAKEGLSNDEEGYKAEFIRLVETVK